jgi:hypothetical protein
MAIRYLTKGRCPQYHTPDHKTSSAHRGIFLDAEHRGKQMAATCRTVIKLTRAGPLYSSHHAPSSTAADHCRPRP